MGRGERPIKPRNSSYYAVARCDGPKTEAIALPLLVDTRFQVLFHSPNRGTFHLSLTVLGGNPGGPSSKAKYYSATDSEPVP